jgi:hypothetical protein
VSDVVGIFELLDSRVHPVVTAPVYENGHATEDGTAIGQNGCLGKRNERQPGMPEAYAKANQEQLMVYRITDREYTKLILVRTDDNQETMLINIKEMKDYRKRDGEGLKGMKTEMKDKMDGNQAEMRSTICVFPSEFMQTIQHEMKAVIQPIR